MITPHTELLRWAKDFHGYSHDCKLAVEVEVALRVAARDGFDAGKAVLASEAKARRVRLIAGRVKATKAG